MVGIICSPPLLGIALTDLPKTEGLTRAPRSPRSPGPPAPTALVTTYFKFTYLVVQNSSLLKQASTLNLGNMNSYFIWTFFRTLAVNIFFKKSFELNRHLDLIVASAILGWTPSLRICM